MSVYLAVRAFARFAFLFVVMLAVYLVLHVLATLPFLVMGR